MGVKSCSRQRCNSIMCDTYVDSIGYVCNECQEEFKLYLEKKPLHVTTDCQIQRALEEFMVTDKGTYDDGVEITVNEFFRKYTN
jgi:hypothetical protein